jgi:hypothetical protein
MNVVEDDFEDIGRRKLTITLAASGVAAIFLLLLAVISILSSHRADLASRVAVENIMVHLNAFEAIASQYNNSRSIANGFNASAAYVMQTLQTQTTLFDVWTQPFVAITYTELAPPTLDKVFPDSAANPIRFLLNTDFRQPRYGGNGTYTVVSGRVADVAGVGCSAVDYVGTAGCVAVAANNGDCDMYTKAVLAEDAGAIALLVWSNSLLNTRVRVVEWRDGDRVVQMPVLSVTRTVKDILTSSSPAYVNLTTSSVVQTHHTFNVFAQTKVGNPNAIVFPGAHLDSVAAGPGNFGEVCWDEDYSFTFLKGINDNGSGSATMLEMAVQMDKISGDIVNAVRFAWWGAEEEGLLGSRYYVATLTQDEKSQIAIYINHDMLAGPNYIIGVNNASDAVNVLPGGITVQNMYDTFLSSHGVPHRLTAM